MLGSGRSSESIWTAFDSVTTAFSRVLKWALNISWKRVQNGSTVFATVGTSLVGGIDIIEGQNSVVVKPDMFTYFDESDKVISVEYDRELNEPLGGIAMAMLDVTLDNSDARFTPEQNATIGTAILPNRPINSHIGFEVKSQARTLCIFKGLTQMPQESKENRTVKISSIDYIRYLNEYPLESTVYTNKRSDEIIADILTTAGFSLDQFILDQGLNTLGFAWFDKGSKAGERIKKICEAEEGFFCQDENGMLRFFNRRTVRDSPYNASVWTIYPEDIISWQEDNSTNIINKITITANPRTVQSLTEIWRNGSEEIVERGETKIVWASFNDPVTTVNDPVATTDYTAFSGTGGTGTDMTGDIVIVKTVFATTVKLEITNNGGVPAYVNFLRLWGTPAVTTGQISQTYEDSASITKYQENVSVINNDLIDSPSFALYLAKSIIGKYKDPRRRLTLTVQGIPQLQLRDMVSVEDPDLGTTKDYRVMRIQGSLSNGYFQQKLYLREITISEMDVWAVVGTAIVDDTGAVVGI